jgi:O-antigen/teichoic acid export membrane protein
VTSPAGGNAAYSTRDDETVSSKKLGLATNAGLALLGDVIAKGGMFVALAFLAHGLEVRAFAHLAIAMAAMVIVTTAIDGGISIVATREGAAHPRLRSGLMRAGAVGRLPLVAIAVVVGLGVGQFLGQTQLAAIALLAATVNAAQIALLTFFRSAQSLVPEAIAKGFSGASYPLFCGAMLVVGHHSAASALLAMTIGPAMTLPVLWVLTRRAMSGSGPAVRPRMLLRDSAPFGLMAIATLAYFRAPLVLTSFLSTPSQTAAYSVASNIAFGLLMLPAALATGLLPRLASEANADRRSSVVKAALVSSTVILGFVAAGVAATASWLIPLAFGRQYENALGPLVILLATGPVIGAAGIIGTAIVVARGTWVLAVQIAVALALNLTSGFILIPNLGAEGAALATLLTEGVSLAMLVAAYLRRRDSKRSTLSALSSAATGPAPIL